MNCETIHFSPRVGVTSGRRYAIVSWAASSGVERVQREPPNRSINWTTREKYIRKG